MNKIRPNSPKPRRKRKPTGSKQEIIQQKLKELRDVLERTQIVSRPARTVDQDHAAIDSSATTFKEHIALKGEPFLRTLRFEYTSGSGEITRRTVDITHFYPNGWPAYVLGHCRLRNEQRAFLIDRMRNVYDLESCSRIEEVDGWLVETANP